MVLMKLILLLLTFTPSSTINNPKFFLESAIENIDIGGPAMVRAAAKNYKSVAVLTNPDEYDNFSKQLIEHNGALDEAYRFKLAQNAFSTYSKLR